MSDISIADLKKTHEGLYEKALRNRVTLVNDPSELDAFVRSIDAFLGDVVRLASQVTLLDDYNWLSDVVLKWHVMFSSVLNIQKEMPSLSVPQRLESAAAMTFYSEKELDNLFSTLAFQQSMSRRTNVLLQRVGLAQMLLSTDEERNQDWRDASIIFAAQVLEGSLHFTRQMGPESYWRLESVWLTDVKKAKAFFIWERRENRPESGFDKADYYAACEEIRQMLVNRGIKGTLEEFEDVKGYLEEKYLDDQGRFDPRKKEAHALLSTKARKVWEGGGDSDRDANWRIAETYCKMFYENIVSAVVAGDPECILAVLKAFQYSKAPENRYLIINCLEVAMAIYFLDSEIIQQLWAASGSSSETESYVASTVPMDDWPSEWGIPKGLKEKLSFSPENKSLTLQGFMTEEERNILLRRFPEKKEAIEALFQRSRLLPRESTL
jgi:hypothetical protein